MMLARKARQLVGTPCPCGTGTRTTVCQNCPSFAPSCNECFINKHQNSPLCWAQVWNTDQGFFVRHDISRLREEGYWIHLGHHGERCPNPVGGEKETFTIIHTNGIHQTRVKFCHCHGPPNKIAQLMENEYFPSSTKDPRQAFTWALLNDYQVHSLEAKKGAYDYFMAIRRLTDEDFAADVSVRPLFFWWSLL